jgi:hypothetical protein
MTHKKEMDKNIRRMKELVEIQEVTNTGLNFNIPFEWDPASDKITQRKSISLLAKISKRTGKTQKDLGKEIELRAMLLQAMANRKETDFKRVNEVVKDYYLDKNKILKEYKII